MAHPSAEFYGHALWSLDELWYIADDYTLWIDRKNAGPVVDEFDGPWLMKMRMVCGFPEFDDAYEVWVDGRPRQFSVIKVPTDHHEYLILRRCNGIGHEYVDGPHRLIALPTGRVLKDGEIPPPTPWMQAVTDDNVEGGMLTGTPLPALCFLFSFGLFLTEAKFQRPDQLFD